MNERIKELAEQAKMFATPMKFHLGGQDYARVRDEKFAELIVAEMLQTCEDHPRWSGRMIGEQIKQHFGVEE